MSVALLAPASPPVNAAEVGRRMTHLLRYAADRSAAVRDFRAYYAGSQENQLTEGQTMILDGLAAPASSSTSTSGEFEQAALSSTAGGRGLVDNQSRIIVDTLRGRLRVAALNCRDEAVQAAVTADWTLNAMAAQQHEVHRGALRDGDAYLLLGWDMARKRVTVDVQRQWAADDGAASQGVGLHLFYVDGRPAVALREWLDEPTPGVTVRRRALYYPDRIERYYRRDVQMASPELAVDVAALGLEVGSASEWAPLWLPGERVWPAPWCDRAGRPLGLPVVHFTNDADVVAATDYGTSELAGAILGLQDMHNDNLCSLVAATRMGGYQMYYGTGIPIDDLRTWKVGPGQVLGGGDVNARIGAIPAGDLGQLIAASTYSLATLARNADLPVHAFTGEWPSAEAIMRAEIGLITRARMRQDRFGPTWGSAFHKATMLRNAFGGASLDTDALISCQWDDAALRDAMLIIQLANAPRPVLSNAQILRLLGIDDVAIERIQRERLGDMRLEADLGLGPNRPTAPAVRDEDGDRA